MTGPCLAGRGIEAIGTVYQRVTGRLGDRAIGEASQESESGGPRRIGAIRTRCVGVVYVSRLKERRTCEAIARG